VKESAGRWAIAPVSVRSRKRAEALHLIFAARSYVLPCVNLLHLEPSCGVPSNKDIRADVLLLWPIRYPVPLTI